MCQIKTLATLDNIFFYQITYILNYIEANNLRKYRGNKLERHVFTLLFHINLTRGTVFYIIWFDAVNSSLYGFDSCTITLQSTMSGGRSHAFVVFP